MFIIIESWTKKSSRNNRDFFADGFFFALNDPLKIVCY